MEDQATVQKGVLQTSETRLIARPYLQLTTAGVVGLGLLGGWAGSNWLTVLLICAVLILSVVWIGRDARLKGTRTIHVYGSAAINLTASAAIVMITGGPTSPFWLLFLVGAIASAMSYTGQAGVRLEWLNTGGAALALFVPQLFALPLERSLVTLAAMQVLTIFMSSRMIRSIFSLLRESGEKLDQSDERYRRLVEHARDVIFTISSDGKITSLNRAFEISSGWPRAQWIGASFDDLLAEADRDRARQQIQRVLSGETLRSFRVHVRTRAGELLVVEMNISSQMKDGQVVGLLGIARDITQEQQAEDILRASEDQYRRLVEHSPYGVVVHVQGSVAYVNPAAIKLIGASKAEELLGKPVIDFVHPDSRPAVAQRLRELSQGREVPPLEEQFIRLDGGVVHVEVSAFPFVYQDQPAVQVVIHDVTERKRVEQLQQALYDIAQAPDGIESLDDLYPKIRHIISGVMPANNFYIALYDAEQDQLVFPYFVDQSDRVEMTGSSPERGLTAYVLRTGKSLLCTQEVHDELERRGEISLLGSPSAIWLGVPLVVGNKTIGAMVVQDYLDPHAYSERDRQVIEYVASQVAKAIERARAEETLRESEARFRGLAEASFEGVLIHDRGVIVQANQAMADLFGLPRPEELIGKDGLAELPLTPESTDLIRENIRLGTSTPYYITVVRPDGTCFPAETQARDITLEGRNLRVVAMRDVTERKRAEEEYARLFEIEQRRRKEALAIAEVGRNISESLQLDVVLERIATYARDLLAAETSAVYLAEPDSSTLRAVAALGPDSEEIKSSPVQMGAGILGSIAVERAPETVNDTAGDRRMVLIEGTDLVPDEKLMGVPVLAREQLIGLIAVWRIGEGQEFKPEEMEFLSALAGQVGVAIENARLFREVQQLNADLEERVAARTAELSQANTLLQAMMDNMPDQIYVKDTQGRFIMNSRAQARLLGLSDPAEVVGKSDFDFFPHAQRAYEDEQAIMRSGQPLVDSEEFVVWPDGRATWVSTTKAPLRGEAGKVTGIFGISRDITNRKQTEEALRKAKVEAEAANHELDAFSYSVSHDLRAPLRAIDGFARILVQEYGPQLPAEARHYLANIMDGSRRMGQLIQDLLMLSRVTRQALRHESVDLGKLAKTIVASLRAEAPQREVEFTIADGLIATGDPGLLHVVMENLLNNAWKYSSKRQQAHIEFGSIPQADGTTAYFVRDDGAGFDMAYAGNLFGTFQRLHAETEFEGTGIGLATVQRIIHRHGGRVWAEAEVDRGATFFFTLG